MADTWFVVVPGLPDEPVDPFAFLPTVLDYECYVCAGTNHVLVVDEDSIFTGWKCSGCGIGITVTMSLHCPELLSAHLPVNWVLVGVDGHVLT